MSAYLPPGCAEWMIPGNRPGDDLAEEYVEALEAAVRMAKAEGILTDDVTYRDLLDDLEDCELELWGESPDMVAQAAIERYMERAAAENEDDEEGGEDHAGVHAPAPAA